MDVSFRTYKFQIWFPFKHFPLLKGHFNTAVGLVGTAGDFLSKYCLDPDTAASACVVLSTASSVASLKIPDITTQKILMAVKKIEKGVDKILKTPLKTALEHFGSILDAVETGNFEIAFETIPVLKEDAMKAFHYMDDEKKISVENFKECTKALKLHMFAEILRTSYNRERKMFTPPDKLQEHQVLLVGKALEKITRKCIDQKEKVKTTSWGFERDSIKYEAQDCLDQILHLAYQYISRAKKLTDIKKQLTISNDALPKFRLLPEFLPMGYEDRTQLTVGVQIDEKGHKSVARIGVWRNETHVYFEYKGVEFQKPIVSESEPVDMELPCPPGPFTLSATREAGRRWSRLLGDYSLTREEHSGRPVYRNKWSRYIYSLEDGGWGVSNNVGDSGPFMRSTSPAPSPALCQRWEYYDGHDGAGDIKITIKN